MAFSDADDISHSQLSPEGQGLESNYVYDTLTQPED